MRVFICRFCQHESRKPGRCNMCGEIAEPRAATWIQPTEDDDMPLLVIDPE